MVANHQVRVPLAVTKKKASTIVNGSINHQPVRDGFMVCG
jgi:hypothetical protein